MNLELSSHAVAEYVPNNIIIVQLRVNRTHSSYEYNTFTIADKCAFTSADLHKCSQLMTSVC